MSMDLKALRSFHRPKSEARKSEPKIQPSCPSVNLAIQFSHSKRKCKLDQIGIFFHCQKSAMFGTQKLVPLQSFKSVFFKEPLEPKVRCDSPHCRPGDSGVRNTSTSPDNMKRKEGSVNFSDFFGG